MKNKNLADKIDYAVLKLLLAIATSISWACSAVVSWELFFPAAAFLTACAGAVIIKAIRKGQR